MNPHGLPDDGMGAFLDNLVSGIPARQVLHPGIQACSLMAGNRPGLALQVARESVQTGQLQRVLERRFEHAVIFDGCYVYLDAEGTLVIWHALPTQRDALEHVLDCLLSLANLDALIPRSSR